MSEFCKWVERLWFYCFFYVNLWTNRMRWLGLPYLERLGLFGREQIKIRECCLQEISHHLMILAIVLSSALSAFTIFICVFLNLTEKYPESSRTDLCLRILLFLFRLLLLWAAPACLLLSWDCEAPISRVWGELRGTWRDWETVSESAQFWASDAGGHHCQQIIENFNIS